MTLREGWLPPKANINVLSGCGGLGDQIARLPAYRELLAQAPHVSVTVWVQDYFLSLAKILLPENARLCYRRLSSAPRSLPNEIEFKNDNLSALYGNLTEHAFITLMGRKAEFEGMKYPRVKPSKAPLACGPYIAFTVASTAGAREWPAVYVNGLASACMAQGYKCILVGNTTAIEAGDGKIQAKLPLGLDESLFINFINMTSLEQALEILGNASAVVGVDNGLLHLAACTDVPIVAGFTSVSSALRVPARSAGLTYSFDANVPCSGCQARALYVNHDFKQCLFGDYACTLTMTSARFIEGLRELGVLK